MRHFNRLFLVLFLTLLPLGALHAQPPVDDTQEDVIPIEFFFQHRHFSIFDRLSLSPDGRYLAYVVVTPTSAGMSDDVLVLDNGTPAGVLGHQLHIMEIETGEIVFTGAEDAVSVSPVWSSDGSQLAYYSDESGLYTLWIYDVAANTSRQVSEQIVNTISFMSDVVAWHPDGDKLMVAFTPDFSMEDFADFDLSMFLEEEAITVYSTADESGQPSFDFEGLFIGNLTLIDLSAGTETLLQEIMGLDARFSPSGRWIALTTNLRDSEDTAGFAYDLIMLDVVNNEIQALAEGLELPEHADFGGFVYDWLSDDDVLIYADRDELYRAFVAEDGTSNIQHLSTHIPPIMDGIVGVTRDESGFIALVELDDNSYAVAQIPADGGESNLIPLPEGFVPQYLIKQDGITLWQPQPDEITLIGRIAIGRDGLLRVNLLTGAYDAHFESDGTFSNFAFHTMAPTDHAFFVSVYQSYSTPLDYYLVPATADAIIRLTEIEPRWNDYAMGTVEWFETEVIGHDNEPTTVRTAIILPPGAVQGDALPAIVEHYGGSNVSGLGYFFGGGYIASMPAHIFSAQGYAVVLVDAPLGPEGVAANPLMEMRDLIVPQVERAAELGYIDIDRVAISGQSYGGYGAVGLASTTDVFDAVIAVAGVYDLPGLYGVLDDGFNVIWSELGQGRMGGNPWDELERYIDNSPYYRAQSIHAPVLLIHGDADTTTPVQESGKMFVALRQLGRTAEFAVYADEGHVIEEWTLPNAIDAVERVLDFLARHMR